MKITNKIFHTIQKYDMISPGDRVVVAVSGGSDSVGLLHLLSNLKKYDLKIIAAHYNHMLRGGESDKDALFVEKLAKKLGVDFEYGECGPNELKEKKGLSPEDAARRLRYKFLNDTLKKYSAHRIATAHTVDDQAETVLMRIIRGSGSHGLSGIPPVNGSIIRPLIELQKKEIRDHLKSNKIRWREDSTNLTTEFQRNKVRHEIFPILKEINPSVNQVLQRSSDIYRIESEFISHSVDKVFNSIVKKKLYGYIGSSRKYLSHNKALRLGTLRKTIEQLKGDLKSVSALHLLAIDEMMESGKPSGEIMLPDGIRFNLGNELFCFSDKDRFNKSYSFKITNIGTYKFDNGLKIGLEISSDRSKWDNESIGFFSLNSVRFPINVRNYRPGDRFRPLGLKGFKKVKDFFIDEKVPRFLRKSVPVFETADGIIWLGGLRNDDRFKVKKRDTEFLRIKISRPELQLINKF